MTASVVFYRGPSMLDGAPIIAVATGLARSSSNTKTGGVVQTYIIREDISPVAAIHSGADASICGDCEARGTVANGRNVGRFCYVTVFQGPLNVWKSFHKGLYPEVSPLVAGQLCRGRIVRLGTYGDPAAVPFHVWQGLLVAAESSDTGYTHQWRRFPEFQAYCMASCGTVAAAAEAEAQGWRVFRIRRRDEPTLRGEVTCPASAEAGHKTTCDQCKACGGNSAKARAHIVIAAHGAIGKVNAFEAWSRAQERNAQ